jgi:hypothetical protein
MGKTIVHVHLHRSHAPIRLFLQSSFIHIFSVRFCAITESIATIHSILRSEIISLETVIKSDVQLLVDRVANICINSKMEIFDYYAFACTEGFDVYIYREKERMPAKAKVQRLVNFFVSLKIVNFVCVRTTMLNFVRSNFRI